MKQRYSFPAKLLVLLLAGLVYTSDAVAQHIQWTPLGMYHSAWCTAMAVTPDGTIYASATPPSGTIEQLTTLMTTVFRSHDHGISWEVVGQIPNSYEISQIAALDNDVLLATVIYPGTGKQETDSSYGVWRSADHGTTWQQTRFRGKYANGSPYWVHSLGSGTAVIGSFDTVFASFDRGLTWRPTVGQGFGGVVIDNTTLVIRNDSSFYSTTDCLRWIRTPAIGNIQTLDPIASGGLIATTIDHRIFATWDLGRRWQTIVASPIDTIVGPIIGFRNGSLAGAIGYASLQRSIDSGRTWSVVNNSVVLAAPGDIGYVLDSTDQAYIFGGPNVYRLSDTGWTATSCAPTFLPAKEIAANDRGMIAWKAGSDLISTSDSGMTWQEFIPTLPDVSAVKWFSYVPGQGFAALVDSSVLVGTSTSFALWRSPDGTAWTSGAALPGVGAPLVHGVDRSGTLYISRSNTLLRTADLGQTFESFASSTDLGERDSSFVALPSGAIILADSGGVYYSDNRGVNWSFRGSDQFAGRITALACDSSGDLLTCVPHDGTFLSSDAGLHWRPMGDGLPSDTSVNMFCYSSAGFWLAATNSGVFALSDGQTTWHDASAGLQDRDALCVCAPNSSHYYVGTSYFGIFTNTSGTSGVHDVSISPTTLSLRAWPNPSSNAFDLAFHVTKPGQCEMRMYDESGTEVKSVMLGAIAAGDHSIHFKNTALVPGSYFIELVSADGAQTIPIVVK